jgi:hypothetical protein
VFFTLAGILCIWAGLTFDKCETSCISDGLALGTRLASVGIGIFLLFTAFSALSLLRTERLDPAEKRSPTWSTGALGLLAFASWVFLGGIIMSAPST